MAEENQGVVSPAFTIKVDEADLPLAARGDVARIVADDAVDAAATLALELNNWDTAAQTVSWSDSDQFAPGKSIEVQLGYTDRVGTVFVGEITGLELSFPGDVRSRLVVRAYDRFHRVRGGRRTKSYVQAKDSDVATQVASQLSLSADVEDSGEVHPYLLQVNQSDVDFLLARARAIGFELLVDDKTLRFRKLRNDRGRTKQLTFTKGLQRFDGYLSTADQVSAVTVRGWDPAAKEAFVARAEAGDVNGRMGGSTAAPAASDSTWGTRTLGVVERPVATQNEADLLARGLLNELALEYLVADAVVAGDPDLAAGSVVELGGLGTRFSGLYYLTRVRHVHDGAYLTHLRARRNAT